VHGVRLGAAGRTETFGETDAPFPFWSFSKTILAVLALKLVERGVLDLDAPLEGRPWTLRQLLGHRAGLRDYGALARYQAAVTAGDAPWPRDDLVDQVMRDGLLFPPGAGWSYSNLGYLFVRDLVEGTSGSTLRSLVAKLGEDVAGPGLHLAETEADFARLRWGAGSGYHPGWVYHGCVAGTALGAARLLQALMKGELLGTRLLAEMQCVTPLGGAVAGRPWTCHGYGLGLMSGRMGDAGRAVGHTGGGPSSGCAVYHFPDPPEPVILACFVPGDGSGLAEAGCAARARPGGREISG
jgi:D-alanyl-D-alanine carboxypeptidase